MNADIDTIDELAADWVARRDAGLSPEKGREFEAWLAVDPRHAEAFAAIEATFARMNAPREQGFQQVVKESVAMWEEGRSKRRRQWTSIWAGMAVAAALAVGFFLFDPAKPEVPSVATMRLQPQQQTLPDGTIVQLNAGAEIATDYTPARRGVTLLRGEAHFAVTKDPSRPFVVTVGKVEVRAVGTAFAVRLDATQVNVLVTEGKVSVADIPATSSGPESPPVPEPIFVAKGGRVSVPVDGIPVPPRVLAVTPEEMSTALAWREMRFEFTRTPLAEAVELFNRKSGTKILLGDPTLAHELLSGVYWANNPEGFAKLLEASLDVGYHREGEDRIVLVRRR